MQESKISTSPNGPLVVKGIERITADNELVHELSNRTVALCRCGQSKSKPFCDGTHGKIGWKDEKLEGRQPRVVDSYVGKTITIHDNRGICAHIGNCTNGLPKVFQMGVEPWINPNAETVEKIIETIKKCPSGALSYSIDGVKYDKFSMHPEIVVTKDGSYYVKGSIQFNDNDHPESTEHYALCRCGKSKNKPFCDGQHWYTNFSDLGEITPMNFNKNEKVAEIQKLAQTGTSENSAMSTLKEFPTLDALVFKGAQLHKMPLNEDIPIKTGTIIGKTARHPLALEMPFYVSHMSFGALSREAKIALAKGSALVGTATCSGEGGLLPDERKAAGKYIYELGTAAFSHNDESIKQADAVEIKIGQGVKPGLGGHLPGHKVTEEIARIRGLKKGEDSISPGRLSGLNTIDDLKQKVAHIREITNGKPVGIKFASGNIEKDIDFALQAEPDFITIDCRGGATGSSPKFLKDNVGIPPIFVIRRARKHLDKVNSNVTLCITGGFRNSADIVKALALGADAVALATASLISIGCIQARVCHTGTCPAGIATQNEQLRQLFDTEKGVKGFVNFYNAVNNELKIFARTNGVNDVHNLQVNDLVTDSLVVSRFTDIEHI
ncbi:MAG: glutamate synthase-related protein [Prolixibacteraceae bacterium]|jgi:glutamate synthase domain-containing protein 2|nr:glutamate synthase-related protein [Prolixibacteraceae bacterium]